MNIPLNNKSQFIAIIIILSLLGHKEAKKCTAYNMMLVFMLQMIDKHGISVILAAIWEGHTDCVKTLLKHVCNNLFIHNNIYIHTIV